MASWRVLGCSTCPMAGMRGRVSVCKHPRIGGNRRCEDWKPPQWCPLRVTPLTLIVDDPDADTKGGA
jgi:hypothetical protein